MLRPTFTSDVFAACDLDVSIADICREALEMLDEREPPTQRAPAFGTVTRRMPVLRIPPEAYRDAD